MIIIAAVPPCVPDEFDCHRRQLSRGEGAAAAIVASSQAAYGMKRVAP
jgi:hypothetical protein